MPLALPRIPRRLPAPPLRAALAALLLAGCATPAPDLAGVEPVTIPVPPFVFDVRVKGNQADATLRGDLRAESPGALAPYALAAIERASGCRVVPTAIRADLLRVRAPLLCVRA